MKAVATALVVGALVCSGARAGADDDAAPGLSTDAAHQLAFAPSTMLPVRGPRFALVTIDVFVELGHPESYLAAEIARRLVASDDDVREVVHLVAFYPKSPPALANEAALEAAVEGRFWPFFDRLTRERQPALGAAELLRLGRDAGLDGDRLAAALERHTHRLTVERMQADSRELGHYKTDLLVNGRWLSAWASEETRTKSFAEARARAQALRDDGVPLSRLYEQLMSSDDVSLGTARRSIGRRWHVETERAPARGREGAPVNVVVFSNLECGACAELAAQLDRLDAAFPGLVRVAWKNLTPPFGESASQTAAEIAVAAQQQGRFWELHDLAFRSRRERLQRVELATLAGRAGVDLRRLERELQSGVHRAAVERDRNEARRLGLGAPGAVVVDGLLMPAPVTFEVLAGVVKSELERGMLERLRGP